MELVSLAKEALQNVVEHAASYRLGQSALRHLDRALWVVEKSARWAVPPPLDQDERPEPELVRPLPWVFFLALLITLRITRETISLLNLVMGKPPLRSADVVMYIQSKRRYLRTLKYQGGRMLRARGSPGPQPWLSRLRSLVQLTMCFRGPSHSYGNNNTTHVSNNDEVLVVKRSKRGRQPAGAAAGDSTMERLIEKMMVDLDADSDDDSSFTLTNVTSIRSDRSDSADSEQETILPHENNSSTPTESAVNEPRRTSVEINFTPNKSAASTPERIESPKHDVIENNVSTNSPNFQDRANKSLETAEEAALTIPTEKTNLSTKEETKLFLQTEKCSPAKARKAEPKTANGAPASAYGKKKGLNSDRRDSDVSVSKIKATDKTM